MAVNKRKVLEAARKHATKGAKGKALKEYNKLLKLDPRDAKLRLEIGDTYRRWGQIAEAIETYTKVAEQFMKEGFDARAVAVYKQILNLDSGSLACYEPLAELYQRMGLTGEATSSLQTAADGYHRAGDKAAALGLLRKMAMLDPSNTTSRLKVADLLHQEGMSSDAVIEYDAVVEELMAQGDAEGVSKVYQRLLEIEPDRVSSLTGYARNLIDRGVADHAEPFARRALEADASPEQYELLGEVLRVTGRDNELVEVYRGLAELYRERGDEERAREILQRYVPSEEFSKSPEPNVYLDESESLPGPGDASNGSDGPDGIDEFDELAPLDDAGRDEFGDENALVDEDLMADDSQMLGNDESGLGVITNLDVANEPPIMDPSSGSDVNEMTRIIPEDAAPHSDDVDQLFAEASVYLRYGKQDQAVANLESVLEIDPTHRGALEKLGEAYAAAEDKLRAIEVWSRAAKLALEENEIEAADAIRGWIASIDAGTAAELVVEPPNRPVPGDPDSVDAPVREDPTSDTSDDVFGESMSGIAPENSFESDLEEIEFDDIEIDVDDASFAGGREDRADAEPHAEVTASESPGEPASESLTFDGSVERESNPEQIGEDIEEADFYLEQGLLDEAEAIYSRVLDVAPNHSHALVRMGEVAAQRGEDPGSSGAGIDFGASVTEVEHDVPDESESTEIGEELTDWGDGVSLADELSVDPIAEDLDGPGEIDEEELSVADLSVGSFDSVDATADDTVDSNGDTRGFPEAVEEGDASLSGEIEVGRIDVTEVDVDSDDSDSDAEDVADETDLPEFSLEEEFDHAVAPGESMAGPDVVTREPAIPELTVTSIDFGEDTDTDGDEAEAEPAGEDFGFDLAAEIGQALDADPNEISSGNSADTSDDGFAAVFAEFKKGVSETLSEGDYEAHYDLGIAYREMGLLDDAMSEFQAAMGNPSRRLGCLHLLGLCALDAGQPDDAIAHLQLAIGTDDLASEQVSALRFDLGRCFEQIGDIEAAKTEYQAVQAENPQFADVGSRLEGIGNPDKPAQDEIQYESFDDFFTDSDDDDGPDGSDAAPERDESLEDVIAEPEDVTEFEPEFVPEVEVEPETESEPEPELEPQPEPPRARKKRKISFF